MSSTLVFGGQVGSEGKGAIVGYLARRNNWGGAICTFMTNAGHTWVGSNGDKVVVQQLPVALVNPEIPHLMIAPGSAITLSQLEKEIDAYERSYDVERRLRIHPRAMIIEQQDVEYEKEATKYLASTAKGCGRALARKVMRSQDVRLARDVPWLKPYIRDTTQLALDLMRGGRQLLIEGSQGFDLDINHGIEYPYCTSRGTSPMQTLADCGIPARFVDETLAVLRTYPIRVGNVVEDGVQKGYSGDFAGKELTWAEVTQRSGSPVALEERTTVTQRVRRVFEMDHSRLGFMADVCAPTQIALTFADYIDHRLAGVRDLAGVDPEAVIKLGQFMAAVEESTGVNVTMVKTGPKDSDMLLCRDI